MLSNNTPRQVFFFQKIYNYVSAFEDEAEFIFRLIFFLYNLNQINIKALYIKGTSNISIFKQ